MRVIERSVDWSRDKFAGSIGVAYEKAFIFGTTSSRPKPEPKRFSAQNGVQVERRNLGGFRVQVQQSERETIRCIFGADVTLGIFYKLYSAFTVAP
jgi:hypothetical protein